MKKERITFAQGLEIASWLARLSSDEYQQRRSVLRKITDPRAKLSAELMYPFLTPQHKGLQLKEEGPSCDDPIAIGNLDFIAGDVVGRGDPSDFGSYERFSQHHAEQMMEQKGELPAFPEGTEIVFPGTVYVTRDSNEVRFFACITYYATGLRLGLIARAVAFRSSCRFLYQLHTIR